MWYASIDLEKLIPMIEDEEAQQRVKKRLARARERSVLEHDFPELVTNTGLAPTIKENPPLIYHLREQRSDEFAATVRNAFTSYRDTLPEHRRLLLDRFTLMDIAIKVVGVSSVGTTCGVILMMAGGEDPLFLQLKEARTVPALVASGQARSGLWPDYAVSPVPTSLE